MQENESSDQELRVNGKSLLTSFRKILKEKPGIIIIAVIVLFVFAAIAVYFVNGKLSRMDEASRKQTIISTPTPATTISIEEATLSPSVPVDIIPSGRKKISATPTRKPTLQITAQPSIQTPTSTTENPTPFPTAPALTVTPTLMPEGCTQVTFSESKVGNETTITLDGAWWLNVSADPIWTSSDFDTQDLVIFLHFQNISSGTIYIRKGGYQGAPLCQTYNWPKSQ